MAGSLLRLRQPQFGSVKLSLRATQRRGHEKFARRWLHALYDQQRSIEESCPTDWRAPKVDTVLGPGCRATAPRKGGLSSSLQA